MTNLSITTAHPKNKRMYLFSSEMNFRTMTSMAIWSYCLIFIDGSMNVLEGNLVVPGEEVSPFFLNSTIVVLSLIMVISLGFYICAAIKAIVGQDGAKYYAPMDIEISIYFKSGFILIALGFFIVMQSLSIIHAPYALDGMSILIYRLFGITCGS